MPVPGCPCPCDRSVCVGRSPSWPCLYLRLPETVLGLAGVVPWNQPRAAPGTALVLVSNTVFPSFPPVQVLRSGECSFPSACPVCSHPSLHRGDVPVGLGIPLGAGASPGTAVLRCELWVGVCTVSFPSEGCLMAAHGVQVRQISSPLARTPPGPAPFPRPEGSVPAAVVLWDGKTFLRAFASPSV